MIPVVVGRGCYPIDQPRTNQNPCPLSFLFFSCAFLDLELVLDAKLWQCVANGLFAYFNPNLLFLKISVKGRVWQKLVISDEQV